MKKKKQKEIKVKVLTAIEDEEKDALNFAALLFFFQNKQKRVMGFWVL